MSSVLQEPTELFTEEGGGAATSSLTLAPGLLAEEEVPENVSRREAPEGRASGRGPSGIRPSGARVSCPP